jgi:pyruvate,water dikinase
MNFGLTIINDFFIMIGLDIVGRALVKKGLGLNELVDLLKTKKNIDSVKPLEAFQTLMRSLPDQFIDEFVSLKVRTNFDPYQEIFSKLEEKGFLLEVEELQDFISEYGDRSFEELKLESLPIKNDPLILQQLMQWSRQQLVNTNLLGSQNKKQAHIQFSFVEKWILNFTRECIEYRESSRLWRGRFYHLYRELIIQLAFQLKKEDTTFEEFELRDFFSLNHEEWLAFADGNLSQKDVQKFMKIRDWKNKKITYPEFLIAVENEPLPHAYQTAMTSSDKLLGQGVSPGVTQGVALVLESPQEIFEQNIKNFILVTKNTDPAWVYIMSKSQGLISEKGSLLSHTAIIGRELGIPTVVGVKDATRILKTGDQLQINGTTGEINYL